MDKVDFLHGLDCIFTHIKFIENVKNEPETTRTNLIYLKRLIDSYIEV